MSNKLQIIPSVSAGLVMNQEDKDTIDVKVVLFRDGCIQFNYDNGNTSIFVFNGHTPTIGLSAGDGMNYHVSSYNGINIIMGLKILTM